MRIFAAALVAAMIATTAPAAAQKLDVSTIKCKEFVESPKDMIGNILMWLTGYYAAEDDDPIIDFDLMAKRGERLGKYCKENPSIGLITAAEGIFGK